MAHVTLYTTDYCPYCVRAKDLLNAKQIAFSEIKVDSDPVQREEMMRLSGRRTVPQIFINNDPIGGYDDLRALHEKGLLDGLLV